MPFLTADTLAYLALFALPALMMIAFSLIVMHVVDRLLERRRRSRYLSREMEERYIRKCFPKQPTDILFDAVLRDSSPHPVNEKVKPLRVRTWLEREEWKVPPSELLDPKSHWN